MTNWLNPYWLFKPKQFLRFSAFVAKWGMRLFSANAELCLRRNFGRRYLPRLFGSVLLCTLCRAIDPKGSFLSLEFVVWLYVVFGIRAVEVFTRRRSGIPEPHTLWTGDPHPFWARLFSSKATVQCWIEPAFLALAGAFIRVFDLFLYNWLLLAAFCLFIKELVEHRKLTRRAFDSMDAKHVAQAMNSATKALQPKANSVKQSRPHRARLPGAGGANHP